MKWSMMLMLLVALFVGGCGHSTASVADMPIFQCGGPSYSCTRGYYFEDGSECKVYSEGRKAWVKPEQMSDLELILVAMENGYRGPLTERPPIVKKKRREPSAKRPPFIPGTEKTDRGPED